MHNGLFVLAFAISCKSYTTIAFVLCRYICIIYIYLSIAREKRLLVRVVLSLIYFSRQLLVCDWNKSLLCTTHTTTMFGFTKRHMMCRCSLLLGTSHLVLKVRSWGCWYSTMCCFGSFFVYKSCGFFISYVFYYG